MEGVERLTQSIGHDLGPRLDAERRKIETCASSGPSAPAGGEVPVGRGALDETFDLASDCGSTAGKRVFGLQQVL
eukprot:2951664-Amphidinium_carterae.2